MYTTLAAVAGNQNMLQHVATTGGCGGRRRINTDQVILASGLDATNHLRRRRHPCQINKCSYQVLHASSTTSNKCASLRIYRTVDEPSRTMVVVHSNIGPGPTANDPSTPPWKGWLVGVTMSFLLPLLRKQLLSLRDFEGKVEAVVETMEQVVEVVEVVAEKVEHAADEMRESLPEGKLKHMLEDIENAAGEAGKAAVLAHQVLHKVQEAEDLVESMIDRSTVKKEHKKP